MTRNNISNSVARRRKIIEESFMVIAKLNTVQTRVREHHLASFAKDQTAPQGALERQRRGCGDVFSGIVFIV
jgi:hypothetical protein